MPKPRSLVPALYRCLSGFIEMREMVEIITTLYEMEGEAKVAFEALSFLCRSGHINAFKCLSNKMLKLGSSRRPSRKDFWVLVFKVICLTICYLLDNFAVNAFR